MSPGYSGTPLAKKLGYKAGMEVCLLESPAEYREWIEPLPDGLRFVSRPTARTDLVHAFTLRRAELAETLAALRSKLHPAAALWISWPKKSAKVPTDVTEDVIRELALPLGFVDIKVCAVSEVWSGLKLVVRKELRGPGV